MNRKYIAAFILITLATFCLGQSIPSDHVLTIDKLPQLLKSDVKTILESQGDINHERLAKHFREQFAQRFFYDHNTFHERLDHYNLLYKNQSDHAKRALDHLSKYPPKAQWLLPFNYQNGEAVNAYALRHLARQHKMVDIAFLYFDDNKDKQYIEYFEEQMQSLNEALASDKYDKIKDGNGVYEVYRAGYRVLNWLWIHNMFLNEGAYSDKGQLNTIATLLQHAQHLYERNTSFRSGNHQTRGMSALAQLAILFSDVEGSDQWFERAMARLSEHLDKEINDDGFQFERSLHYHMSDINNYFFVYQLAKINNIEVDKAWEEKLRTLFITLTKIAYPDKHAPVLQDDTEIPWAEVNDISGVMTLGYLLFEDAEFGYFASNKVADRMYWFLSQHQIELLEDIKKKQPTYGSLVFPETGYYVMRKGWDVDDHYMIVSAGLDADKPDHQHGDMLGIQAMANGEVILPNYQVRYSLKDFNLFKNSMVKNVALVDNELQGKQWTSNKGGSGFGKFKNLPQPKVLAWNSNENFDLFIGSHDGFEDIGVEYSRQVIYIKDAFYIVKDNFTSEHPHSYKQVWQGHYSLENSPNLLRATFPKASGCDILQLNSVDTSVQSGSRGKNWTVVAKHGQDSFNFITIIFPYKGYHNRIDELATETKLADWDLNQSAWKMEGSSPASISQSNENYFFGISALHLEDIKLSFEVESDVYIALNENELSIHLLSSIDTDVRIETSSDKFIETLEVGGLDLKLNVR